MKPLLNPLSMLVVEEDVVARDALVGALKNRYPGLIICSEGNGSSGLECFIKHSPEIIITDLRMPVLNGISMASEIKSLSSEAVIVAVTAHADAGYLLDAIEAGCTHYLLKPLDCGKLFALIDKSVARKEMEDALLKSEKELKRLTNEQRSLLDAERIRTSHLVAMGELAAGVAHEINNPIQSIINYAQYVHSDSKADSQAMECASRIIMEGERIANIVRTLLGFARKSEDGKIRVNISDIVRQSLVLAHAQLRKDYIKVSLDLNDTTVPPVYADPQQVLQVVLNLISNSRYALNRKYPAADPDKCVTVSSALAAPDGKPMVEVVFSDNGIGIAEPALHRVLDPFYTNKPSHEGTGLGLSISHSIISNHGGTLKVESSEGENTRITFTLPVWRDA